MKAQDRIPREYTSPEELISFDRQTPFQDAIQVIDQFAQEFEGRFVIDRTGYTGEIGINLPAMHWQEALNFILRVRNMVLYENPDYYEILTSQQVEERQQLAVEGPSARTATTTSGDQITATIQTREVRINATFFEGNRRALREIGVDWSTLTNNIPANILDFTGEEGEGELPSTQFDGRFVQVNARGAQNVSQSVFNSLINFGEIGAGIEVQALFSAFEADNIGEVLATPSIKVMDRVEGRIQVGQDFSIKQRDFAGNVTDEFFSTGTILTVTPQIIEDRDSTFIYLELEVERSTAQPDPVSTVINKEEASTHTLLLNGESTVIAGLYRTDKSEVRRGIPILKDLPGWFFGLKYLFGYNSTDISQSELIVIVQAELEKSLPERMNEQLRSKREQLERQKIFHRTHMDHLPLDESESAQSDVKSVGTAGSVGMVIEGETGQNLEMEDTPEMDSEQPDETMEVNWQRKETLQSQEMEAERIEEMDSVAVDEVQPNHMENLDDNYSELLFYTIGGSFSEKDRAMNLYRRFLGEGYKAHILFNPRTDYYFVAYDGFEEFEDASRFTRRIQRDVQPDAWLSQIITERRLEIDNDR
ncbi:MAG: hypothetical protein WDZ36_03255 [Balneolaceae bacterium]